MPEEPNHGNRPRASIRQSLRNAFHRQLSPLFAHRPSALISNGLSSVVLFLFIGLPLNYALTKWSSDWTTQERVDELKKEAEKKRMPFGAAHPRKVVPVVQDSGASRQAQEMTGGDELGL